MRTETEREQIRKELADVGVACLKDPNPSPVSESAGCGSGSSPTLGACQWAPNPTQIILDRLHYHQQQIRGLDALYNALPRELPREAANTLAQLLLDAKPRF